MGTLSSFFSSPSWTNLSPPPIVQGPRPSKQVRPSRGCRTSPCFPCLFSGRSMIWKREIQHHEVLNSKQVDKFHAIYIHMITQVFFVVVFLGVVITTVLVVVPLVLIIRIHLSPFFLLLHPISTVVIVLGGSSGPRRPREYDLSISLSPSSTHIPHVWIFPV